MDELRFILDQQDYTFPYVFVLRDQRDRHDLDIRRFTKVISWCGEQFDGSIPNRWTYTVTQREFLFRLESDATAFKLRWC
jgi:hypothetical protein